MKMDSANIEIPNMYMLSTDTDTDKVLNMSDSEKQESISERFQSHKKSSYEKWVFFYFCFILFALLSPILLVLLTNKNEKGDLHLQDISQLVYDLPQKFSKLEV